MKPSMGVDSIRVLVVSANPAVRESLRQVFGQQGWSGPQECAELETAGHWLVSTDWDVFLVEADFLAHAELPLDELWNRNPDAIAVALNPTETPNFAAHRRGVFESVITTDPGVLTQFLCRVYERSLQRLELDVTHEVIDVLIQALESRDRFQKGHSRRVALLADCMGQHLGLAEATLEILDWSARLHDVGKVGVHEDILNKPGPLTAEEFEIMKRHPALSREIVSAIDDLAPCLPVIYHHHERIDGRGYPDGIAGEQIPLLSRIISVADAYDAMSHDRAHRPALEQDRVEAIMREVAGTQLDAELVDLFLKNKPWLVDVSERSAKKCWASRA